MGSLAAQNLHDTLSQPPKPKTKFRLFYEDINNYSKMSLRGNVIVQFRVDKYGKVIQPEILDTFNTYLNDTIIDKVLAIEFEPALQNGKPVEVNYRLRIPNSSAVDLFDVFKLCFANKNATISKILSAKKPIYRNFWEPMCVSILNTAPEEASAALFFNVLKKTIVHGFEACHPCIAEHGLSQSFIDPAINYLKENHMSINFNSRLHLRNCT